jgi:glycerol-3-phosphate dehydrogenase
MKKQLEADVVIIGAGITGTSIAQELSKYKVETILVEKAGHIAAGQTKGSSGTIYGGGLNNVGSLIVKSFAAPNAKLYDPEYQRLKFQHEGREMWPRLLDELDIEHEDEPVVIIARNKEEITALEAELKLGQSIGGKYSNMRWLEKDALFALYPHLVKNAVAALYSERDGIITYAWQLALAMAENAQQNGVKMLLNAEVIGVARRNGYQLVETAQGLIKTKFVVNAAGLFADVVADMGGPRDWELYQPQAFNIVLDRRVGYTLKGTLFLPAIPGVVVVIARSMDGNIIVNAGKYRPSRDKYDVGTYRDGFTVAMETAKKIIPDLSEKDIIRSFVALRSFNTRNPEEHIIEPSSTNPRFINVAVRLPGLSGQPAISKYVVGLLGDAGLELTTRSDFNPYRKAIPRFRDLNDDERARLIAQDPRYGRVICRCETVTEGEIVEAIKRGARTVAGVKYMTRVGMGRCQGGFCGPRVVSIIARELNIPVTQVTELGVGSPVVPYRSKELLQETMV